VFALHTLKTALDTPDLIGRTSHRSPVGRALRRAGTGEGRTTLRHAADCGWSRGAYPSHVGKFIYGTMATSVDIEDRTLAHLRIAVMTKLRRKESFMFEAEMGEGIGRRSFWMHESVPLQFHFAGSRPPRINPAWVEALIIAAGTPAGLTILPEPPAPKASDAPPVA